MISRIPSRGFAYFLLFSAPAFLFPIPVTGQAGEPDTKLMEQATIVVIGTVTSVDVRHSRALLGRRGGDSSNYSATIRVESAEKGQLRPAPSGGYVSLKVEWKSIVSAGVFYPHVGEGDRCRFYLTRDSTANGWSPVFSRLGSGIEILERADKKKPAGGKASKQSPEA